MAMLQGAGGVLFNSSRTRVLLVEEQEDNEPTARKAGQLSIPMGRIEQGETPAQCAEREFLEESGVCVKAEEFIGTYRVPGRDAELHVFLVRMTGQAETHTAERFPVSWVEVGGLARIGNLRYPTQEAVLEVLSIKASRPS